MSGLTKEKFMTVREVAETLNRSERTIRRAVEALYPDLMENGKTTRLNQEQVTKVKARIISNAESNKLDDVDQLKSVTTKIERLNTIKTAMQYLIEDNGNLTNERDLLKSELLEQKPKVDYYDSVMSSKDTFSMRDVASVIDLTGWGRNKIFELLRNKDVLDNKNVPYRRFQDTGYFRTIENTYTDNNGDVHTTITTRIYSKGIEYIKKLIRSV